jgi:hypothetical protein
MSFLLNVLNRDCESHNVDWAGALHSEAVSCMLLVGSETKMEIPVYRSQPEHMS